MKALILAAGRGERMRPLTDVTPKPLLVAGGRRLIEWQIAALARAGVDQFVVNTAHLGAEFPAQLGQGERLGVSIAYSHEGQTAEQALETRGGIVRALPLLAVGDEPFVVVAGDIVTDFDYSRLAAPAARIAAGEIDAHLVLVPNPDFHPRGDMGLAEGRIVRSPATHTFASLAVFSPRIFRGLPPERAKLFPWLYQFADAGRVSGEIFTGRWANVGTPRELARLEAELAAVAS
ncbi:MAG: nucleotidyltransferase family protein [Burkholderiaceae bacterium]